MTRLDILHGPLEVENVEPDLWTVVGAIAYRLPRFRASILVLGKRSHCFSIFYLLVNRDVCFQHFPCPACRPSSVEAACEFPDQRGPNKCY